MFASAFPEYYSTFSRAMVTQMQITTGDGWVRNIFRPFVFAEVSTGRVATSLFFIVYAFITAILLMNVLIAVTYDGYARAVQHYKVVSLEEAYGLLMTAESWQERRRVLYRALMAMPPRIGNFLGSQAFLGLVAEPLRPSQSRKPQERTLP